VSLCSSSNGYLDISQAIEPDFIIDKDNNLHLIYSEVLQGKQKLVYLHSIENFEWNLTRTYIDSPITDQSIHSRASILTWHEKIIVAFAVGSSGNYTMVIMNKGFTDTQWQLGHSYWNSSEITRPILRAGSEDYLWLVWMMRSNGIMNIFSQMFNWTSQSWGNLLQISEANTYDCSEFDYFVDNINSGHFTWAEGGDNKQVFYRKVLLNESMLPIATITDGTTNCVDPICLQNQENSIDVFWSNYTDPYAGDRLGTIFVNNRKVDENNTLTAITLAAPYTSIHKPGESDAYSPSVEYDSNNILWLAFTARDDNFIYRGVNLRARISGIWETDEHISQISNTANEPHIKIDGNNNIHCIWVDFRSGYAQLYYRLRLSSGLWIDETLLTYYISESGIGWKWIGITAGIILGATIPLFIISQFKKHRKQKLTGRQKKELLQD